MLCNVHGHILSRCLSLQKLISNKTWSPESNFLFAWNWECYAFFIKAINPHYYLYSSYFSFKECHKIGATYTRNCHVHVDKE